MDKLANMQAFAVVAETGSFAGAAKKLNLANSVVSKRVKDLEDFLGTQLFTRTTRQVSLTDTGYSYLEYVQNALDEMHEIESRIRYKMDNPVGTIKLSAPVSYGIRNIGPAITSYLDKYPDVKIKTYLSDRQVDLVEEGFDLAIRIGKLSDSNLIARKLAQYRLVACATPEYLKAHGTPKTPEDLKNHNCLTYLNVAEGKAWPYYKDGKRLYQAVNGCFQADNGDLLTQATLNSIGIALQPSFIIGPHLKSGELKAVLEDYEDPDFSVYAVYQHTRHLSPKVRTLIDHFVECFR